MSQELINVFVALKTEYKYITRDGNGEWWAYTGKPKWNPNTQMWNCRDNVKVINISGLVFPPATLTPTVVCIFRRKDYA